MGPPIQSPNYKVPCFSRYSDDLFFFSYLHQAAMVVTNLCRAAGPSVNKAFQQALCT